MSMDETKDKLESKSISSNKLESKCIPSTLDGSGLLTGTNPVVNRQGLETAQAEAVVALRSHDEIDAEYEQELKKFPEKTPTRIQMKELINAVNKLFNLGLSKRQRLWWKYAMLNIYWGKESCWTIASTPENYIVPAGTSPENVFILIHGFIKSHYQHGDQVPKNFYYINTLDTPSMANSLEKYAYIDYKESEIKSITEDLKNSIEHDFLKRYCPGLNLAHGKDLRHMNRGLFIGSESGKMSYKTLMEHALNISWSAPHPTVVLFNPLPRNSKPGLGQGDIFSQRDFGTRLENIWTMSQSLVTPEWQVGWYPNGNGSKVMFGKEPMILNMIRIIKGKFDPDVLTFEFEEAM